MTESIINEIKKCVKCDKKQISRGYCGSHYMKAKKNGEFDKLDPVNTGHMNIKDRLEYLSEKVTESGCQIWKAALVTNGYGIISISGKMNFVHRLSYELHVGKIPKGWFVCHKCDVRSCINPEHLFIGTSQDNVDDMVNKKRQNKGEDRPQHKLTEEDVIKIRKDDRPQYIIANDYKVSQKLIYNVKKRTAWKHVL